MSDRVESIVIVTFILWMSAHLPVSVVLHFWRRYPRTNVDALSVRGSRLLTNLTSYEREKKKGKELLLKLLLKGINFAFSAREERC